MKARCYGAPTATLPYNPNQFVTNSWSIVSCFKNGFWRFSPYRPSCPQCVPTLCFSTGWIWPVPLKSPKIHRNKPGVTRDWNQNRVWLGDSSGRYRQLLRRCRIHKISQRLKWFRNAGKTTLIRNWRTCIYWRDFWRMKMRIRTMFSRTVRTEADASTLRWFIYRIKRVHLQKQSEK